MRTSGRRMTRLGLVAALVLGGLAAAPVVGAAPKSIEAAPDSAAASAAAVRQGTRVEVLDQRSATRTVYANPDGSHTTEMTALPTRFRRGDDWLAIDRTLVTRGDGSVAPKAVGDDVALSGGGDAPLVRMTAGAAELALRWPTALPKPVLAGDSATYPDVFPGVDLVIRAREAGYQQLLVVKTAEAARNPALARVRLRVATKGVTVSVDKTGALWALDDKQQVMFASPASEMWDAKSRRATVGVELAGDVLALVPDQAFLADRATVYPVTIDPTYTPYAHNFWATVLSGQNFRDKSFPWTSADPNHPEWSQVGQCYDDGWCNGIGEAWGYFQFFDTGGLAGKDILEAKFYTTVMYSPNCQTREHRLRWVSGGIGSGVNWNNKPEYAQQHNGQDNWIGFAAPDSCGGAHGVELDIRGTVNTTGATTYYLRAADGNDQLAWRKYDPAQTRITVRWNRTPNQPTALRTDPPTPAPCRWCGGIPYLSDSDIRVIATVSDPDNDRVRPNWRVQAQGRAEEVGDGDWVPSGASVSRGVSLADKDGLTVKWWVHAQDDALAMSPQTYGQTFAVDRTPVTKAPTVDAKLYIQDGFQHGGVGVPDTFTFGSNGVSDIDHYLYDWIDSPETSVDASALGGTATVTIAPVGDGPRTLYVQSVDRAGHKGPVTAYNFYVRAGDGARAQWSFEGNTKDSAYMGNRDGTLNGGVSYTSGAVGTSLLLDGRAGSTMSAPNTVRTDTSFSVSAWVRLDDLPRNNALGAVSQDNDQTGYSGWLLHYRDEGAGPKWAFWVPGGYPDQLWAGQFAETTSPAYQPQLGKWTQLTGVYDRVAGEVRLYVDGALAAKKTAPGWVPWQANGQLAVGRVQWNNTPMHFWRGAIDEVQVFDRALSDAEVAAKVSKDNVRTGHWRFDESATPDNKTRNEVAGGRDGVLTNGASLVDNGDLGRAVSLDGQNDQVVTSGPAVHTDKGFSVSAWVWPNQFPANGASMTAVSQDGQSNSGFYLQYNGTQKKWAFTRMSHDTAGSELVGYPVAATQTPVANAPVHLAGVYDAATKEMRIYVNGEPGTAQPLVFGGTDWDATGPLVIGRGKFKGESVDPWNGRVDEVRTYSRPLSAAEIKAIAAQNRVSAGTWKLDGNADDASGRGLNGTWTGTPAWAPGQSDNSDPADQAAVFTGSNGIETPNAVDSTESYTVSAWVRPNAANDCSCTIVSQSYDRPPAFALRIGTDGKFRMSAFGTVESSGGSAVLQSDTAAAGQAQAGVWTHVVGVYDKQRQQLELYVNGALVDTAKHTTPHNNGGKLSIGQVKSMGLVSERFVGAIDDVRIYSRALFGDEIRVMAGRDLSLVHNWKMNDSAVDSIGSRGGTVVGGAGYGQGRAGKSITLDGTDDAVSTTGVDLRTDQSFTVSAWVNLTRPGPCATECTRDAVSLATSAAGPVKFRLGHRIDQDQAQGNGKWIFELPESTGAVTKAAVSVRPSQFDNWVLLVGVYDAGSGQIDLYVYTDDPLDEPDHDTGRLLTPWHGKGGLQIGRAVTGPDATAIEFWQGGIDDVRLYTGALSVDRLSALRNSYPAVTAS